MCGCVCFVFFFKQKTAYEMRISDWSSDVCSSDLAFPGRLSRIDSAVAAGRGAGVAMAGVILMLLVAGLLEGIGRQTILVDWQRYLIAFGMLAGWLVYFYPPRRRA